jgi:hypothetical protein
MATGRTKPPAPAPPRGNAYPTARLTEPERVRRSAESGHGPRSKPQARGSAATATVATLATVGEVLGTASEVDQHPPIAARQSQASMDNAPPKGLYHRIAGSTPAMRRFRDVAYVPSLIEPAALRGGGLFFGARIARVAFWLSAGCGPRSADRLGSPSKCRDCWPLKRQRATRFRSACAKPQPDDRYCHNYRTLCSRRPWLNSTPPRVPITWEAYARAAGPALGASPPVPDVGPHSENAITGRRPPPGRQRLGHIDTLVDRLEPVPCDLELSQGQSCWPSGSRGPRNSRFRRKLHRIRGTFCVCA